MPVLGTVSGSYVTGIEKLNMLPADVADTTYSDGKVYKLEIPVRSEHSSVRYRFVFSDGTRTAVAYGVTERTLELTPP